MKLVTREKGGCVSLKTFLADKLAQDAIPLEDMNH